MPVRKAFDASMSSKGQLVIAKEIREELGLKKNQRFIERIENGKVVLEPVSRLMELKGVLKGKTSKSVKQIMQEIDEGWS